MKFKFLITIYTLLASAPLVASSISLTGSVGQLDDKTGPVEGSINGTELKLSKDIWYFASDYISLVAKFSRTAILGVLEDYSVNLTNQNIVGMEFGVSYTSQPQSSLFDSRVYSDFVVGAGTTDIEVQRFDDDNFTSLKSGSNTTFLSSASVAVLYSWSDNIYLKPEIQMSYSSIDLQKGSFTASGEVYSGTSLSLAAVEDTDMRLNEASKLKNFQYALGFGVGFDF